MGTATHTDPHKAHGKAGATAPAPVDPEHEINAKATITWVLAWTVVLVIGLYLLLVVFDAVLFRERQRKVEQLPAKELQQRRDQEQRFLSGQWEEGAPRKSIDQVMTEMTPR